MQFEKNNKSTINPSSIIDNSIQVVQTLEFFLKLAEVTEDVIKRFLLSYELTGAEICTYENKGQYYFYLENNKHVCYHINNLCFRYVNPENQTLEKIPTVISKERQDDLTKYSSKKITALYLACANLDTFLYEIIKKVFQSKQGLVGEYHHHVEFAAKCIFEEKL